MAMRGINDNNINANYYFEIAKRNLLKHKITESRIAIKISLSFERRAEFLELLGNSYLEQSDYETANQHYEAAASSDATK